MFTITYRKEIQTPLKMCRHFLLSVSEYPYYNPGAYLKIQYTKKQFRSNCNDTNGRYDIQKNYLELILMIQTGDTTYEKATYKSF